MKETLYNGIKINYGQLPLPPDSLTQPLSVPYLENPPEVIPVDVGRQLFVDDFLIHETDLTRIYHQPSLMDMPVFYPETPLERNNGICPVAAPFDDGVFYDKKDGLFKLWYQAGWFQGIGYAQSEDGIHWKRLSRLGIGKDNDCVLPVRPGEFRDGAAVWLDENAQNPSERYKMFAYYRTFREKQLLWHQIQQRNAFVGEGRLYRSANGIDWGFVCPCGPCGDNTTFFYNPFRKKWVFSIRTHSKYDRTIRDRGYMECDDFYRGATWKEEDIRFWLRTDCHDKPDEALGYPPQLYKVNATAYESIMLGMFGVYLGPPNEICEKNKRPKIIDLKLAYSRDGFHWSRGDYQPFLRSSRIPGRWDFGYLHIGGGVCVPFRDKLYFYYSAWSGHSPCLGTHMYADASMGLATLRRDGFASMDAQNCEGTLLTRTITTKRDRLFINADALHGEIRVEICTPDNKPVTGFTFRECVPFRGNDTRAAITWNNGNSIFPGHPVRLRFRLYQARIYSFWFGGDKGRNSYGHFPNIQ